MEWQRVARGSIGLLLLVSVLWLVAWELFETYGMAGGEALNIAVSGALSLALVVLYYRQMEVLQSQRDLLTQELNREARQQHTETLREIVRVWLGDYNPSHFETSGEMTGANTPSITRSAFESAPQGRGAIDDDDEGFHIAPVQLRDNRYFEDLLEHHAPELRTLTDRIEDLHEQYTDQQDAFADHCSAPTSEHDVYTLSPTDYFSTWVFHQVVRLERDFRDDWSDMTEVAISKIKDTAGSVPDQRDVFWVRAGGGTAGAIYGAQFEQPVDELDTDAVRAAVITHVEETLERLEDDQEAREVIQQAATTLEEAAEAISELEETLIEYEGRPIITGDCPYLTEARIDPEHL